MQVDPNLDGAAESGGLGLELAMPSLIRQGAAGGGESAIVVGLNNIAEHDAAAATAKTQKGKELYAKRKAREAAAKLASAATATPVAGAAEGDCGDGLMATGAGALVPYVPHLQMVSEEERIRLVCFFLVFFVVDFMLTLPAA